MKDAIITGAGGFLGRNLCQYLLRKEPRIRIYAFVSPKSHNAVASEVIGQDAPMRIRDRTWTRPEGACPAKPDSDATSLVASEVIEDGAGKGAKNREGDAEDGIEKDGEAIGEGRVIYLPCDLCDIGRYASRLPDNIDILYHLAWRGVRPEDRNDFPLQLSNLSMTMACMDFAAQKKVRAFLFPGSTNEYLYYGKPLDGEAVPTPRDAYGSVKVALRYLCQQYARQHDMNFLYTIIAGIYAADRQDNNVIFYTIRQLLEGRKPSLTGLSQLWDYVYIDDVTEALRLVGERGKDGTVYAIGHGDNWPLRNYIERVRDCIDPALPLGIGEIPYQSDVLPSSCINLENVMRDTGFRPQVDFGTGIRRVLARLREEKEGHT